MNEHLGKANQRSFRGSFCWLVLAALLLGMGVTLYRLFFSEVCDLEAYEAPNILLCILTYTALAWVGLLMTVWICSTRLCQPAAKLLRRLICWFFSWRIIKRCLLVLAGFLGLALLFRVEEDWRGKRAWENYRREWEAKGEHFDFAYFIPPPVPDDQNFALTPIVASCYSHVLDQKGHQLKSRDTESENTGVANRLAMNISRQKLPTGTNLLFGSWQQASLTDLKAWQEYYRAAFLTNEFPMWIPTWTNGELSATQIEIEPLATNEFPTAPQPQTPAADVLLALSKYDAAVEELRQASRLPYSRFPLAYAISEPPMLFPHYETMKKLASILRFRAVAELNNGQAEKALADVQLILYLANSIRNEPITWSLRVRMEILDNAIQPVWEGLARRQWSEEQLVALERELAGLDATSDYSRTLRSHLVFDLEGIDYLRAVRMTNSIFRCMCNNPPFWPNLVVRLLPSGWFYLNKVTIARCYQAALPTSAELRQRILSPAIARRIAEIERRALISRMKPNNWLVGSFWPSLEREATICALTQTSVDLARVACALERFRLANGSFPESLDALVPTYIQKLPHDVINGQPLHYRRTADGDFLLYSVGWNGKDDGGERDPEVLRRYWIRFVDWSESAGDRVWRYPAN